MEWTVKKKSEICQRETRQIIFFPDRYTLVDSLKFCRVRSAISKLKFIELLLLKNLMIFVK